MVSRVPILPCSLYFFNLVSAICILKTKSAYTIMPIGKKIMQVHCGRQRKAPVFQHRGQWHQPVRTLKRTGSFLSKKRKIHPWLIFLFFEFEVLYYSHHPCIVTYPLVLKHFCIGGLRLPSIRNFAVGMELIHLPHRL